MDLGERENIYNLLQQGFNQSSIATILGRHRSSIAREVRRCTVDPLGYLPDRAERDAQSFLRRNPQIFRSEKLRTCVTLLLKKGWSPEQISGRLKLEQSEVQVSHETIYKFIYSEEGQKQKLYLLLTRKKVKRTRWYSRKPKKSHIPDAAGIAHRPKSIEKRKTIVSHIELGA